MRWKILGVVFVCSLLIIFTPQQQAGMAVFNSEHELKLMPLSPYSVKGDLMGSLKKYYPEQAKAIELYQPNVAADHDNVRVDYYFIPVRYENTPEFRNALLQQLEKIKIKISGYDYYSILIYEQNGLLNAGFKGGEDEVNSLSEYRIAFARWKKDKMDMCGILENSEIVFDVLKNKAVDPPEKF